MKVYYDQSLEPDPALPVRTHPWTASESDGRNRYYDFRSDASLIRTHLEDYLPYTHKEWAEEFFQFLEWLNGPESMLESNDCGLMPLTSTMPGEPPFDLKWHGRVMVFCRDLSFNLSPECVHWLCQQFGGRIQQTDPEFDAAAIGITIMPTLFEQAPGETNDEKCGQLLQLSYWAFGNSEVEADTSFTRLLKNFTAVARQVSEEIRAGREEHGYPPFS